MSFTPFQVETVPLSGSNLIEASAGTGKTYSIAVLALRLILSGTTVKEILMVTFTNKAVEELETRIRHFVHEAKNYVNGEDIDDAMIKKIVDMASQEYGLENIQTRLKNAVLLLDETSIQTIHSFCQRTLTEYAFETGQIFGSDIITTQDAADMMQDALNRFWRRHITTMNIELLRRVLGAEFGRAQILEAVKLAMQGKKIFRLVPYTVGFLDADKQERTLEGLDNLQAAVQKKEEENIADIEARKETIIAAMLGNKTAAKNLKALIDDFTAEKLYEYLCQHVKKPSQYIQALFSNELRSIEAVHELELIAEKGVHGFVNQLYQFAVDEISGEIELAKREKGVMSFDDMITRLHDAIVIKQHKGLRESLQHNYKAAFIDEFQDTDKLQYEIFQTLFGEKNILFYIGDPKQSIYSFRKADIHTYFKAAAAVNNRYSMNTNFRSSNQVIKALNHFFVPEEGFDTFYFKDAPGNIEYISVDAPEDSKKGELLYNDEPITPVIIHSGNSQRNITFNTVSTVIELLQDTGYTLPDGETRRNIRPSDFGILVRNKFQAQDVKQTLAYFNVPAVTIDDTKVLGSEEAKMLLYVMEAVYAISAASVNKALVNPLTGITINDLLQMDEAVLLERFRLYQQSWQHSGIYVMLNHFITDYKIRSQMLAAEMVQGERKLSNIIQLVELFHKMEKRQQYAPAELLNWLKRSIENEENLGDEFEQRIESDGDAVQIITIHKCKGLEYNIVIAPFLDLNVKMDVDFFSFREPDEEEYYFTNSGLLTDQQKKWYKTETEQENRRLFYVAMTRAKYICYVNNNTFHLNNNSTLRTFLNALDKDAAAAASFGIVRQTASSIPPDYRYTSETQQYPVEFAKAENFALLQPNWKKMSYSFLNPEHTIQRNPRQEPSADPYDRFAFHELKKGAHTGNLLHYIFERIDFTDPTGWRNIVEQAAKRLSVNVEQEKIDNILIMLDEVIHLPLRISEKHIFTLSEVKREERINELEFDFGVAPFSTADIEALGHVGHPLSTRSYAELEGIMNGKIDLFFERNGRYYILDWKSNHLGNQLSDYDDDGVLQAMTDNNYHLQYTIYTLALKKFLESRLPKFDYDQHFGGVIYLFLRGVRKNADTGIFYHKPDIQLIQKMEKLFRK